MTTTELQLKTKRFTAKMNVKELRKTRAIIEEMIEDAIDAQDVDRILKRIKSGKDKWVSHEDAKSMLGLK